MFFYASKVVFLLIQPSSLALLALLAGLVLLRTSRRPVAARRLIAGGIVWLVGAGFLPIGNALILPLEQRFGAEPPALAADADVAGVIMLGGFEDGWVSAGHGSLAVNEAAERLTETLRLAARFPKAKVVFTGGVGELFQGESAEQPLRAFLADVGIAPERIVVEHKSRNTHENAEFTRAMIGARAGARHLLVTSAYHMPRSVGVFRRSGFDVVPYPVDYRTRGSVDLVRLFGSMPDGLKRADLAAKEWIGLLAYRLSGRTDALFPAP